LCHGSQLSIDNENHLRKIVGVVVGSDAKKKLQATRFACRSTRIVLLLLWMPKIVQILVIEKKLAVAIVVAALLMLVIMNLNGEHLLVWSAFCC
jgi:hypothetical protein